METYDKFQNKCPSDGCFLQGTPAVALTILFSKTLKHIFKWVKKKNICIYMYSAQHIWVQPILRWVSEYRSYIGAFQQNIFGKQIYLKKIIFRPSKTFRNIKKTIHLNSCEIMGKEITKLQLSKIFCFSSIFLFLKFHSIFFPNI